MTRSLGVGGSRDQWLDIDDWTYWIVSESWAHFGCGSGDTPLSGYATIDNVCSNCKEGMPNHLKNVLKTWLKHGQPWNINW